MFDIEAAKNIAWKQKLIETLPAVGPATLGLVTRCKLLVTTLAQVNRRNAFIIRANPDGKPGMGGSLAIAREFLLFLLKRHTVFPVVRDETHLVEFILG